jgi:(1->4)-alpha-D-glucan 1-alpha-D-glucosylmutase
MAQTRIPLSCYRLQFNQDFTFSRASDALGYLSRLGITDIYASPLLQSRSGSQHGYDVTDPSRIDSELGNEEQFEAFQSTLQKQGMGLLLDIVPNHMAASPENPWWMDVLENGPGSAYAAYFDIDWHPPSLTLDNKILLPVLGSFYGQALNNREFQLVFRRGSFLVQYYDMFFPLTPKSYRKILKHREHILERRLGADSTSFQEYLGVVAALAALPDRESLTINAAGERRLQVEGIKERLRQLYETNGEVQRFVTDNLRIFNGRRNQAGSFRDLDRLLSEQAFVLAYWQNVNEGINYRRFFTITDLVGVRVEDPMVFEAIHHVVLQLIERRVVTGLRIDHIDGLRDPLGYLRRLEERASSSRENADPDSFYVIVEKILSGAEKLPREWPVQGTTGYEYLNAVNRLFVHPEGARAIEQVYFRFLGRQLTYEDVLYQRKKLVMSTLLSAEMRYLGRQLAVLAQSDRYARDFSRMELAQALIETTACFPVYRTYLRSMEVTDEAKRHISRAVEAARSRNPRLDSSCFDFVRDVLLLKDAGHLFAEQREARLAFVMRWQQFTGPIVAKGLEDTVLYVYCPLLSLNEVGGNPSPSAVGLPEFSQVASERQRRWRYGLNSTSTHDTKRGEDVRSRINVLSEIPHEWQKHLTKWARWNAKRKGVIESQEVPDRNEEIFLYQTLIGAWPLEKEGIRQFPERLEAYIIKAIREAMVHTRWTLPNKAHERAVVSFLKALLKPAADNLFLNDFLKFQRKVAPYGMLNGLAQVLVKMTSPGVPDFYQGCDLWDLRLVDPDNRGPVDFSYRSALLDEIEKRSKQDPSRLIRELVQDWQDGRIKLYLIWKILNLRRRYPRVFLDGQFLPLKAIGERETNLIAYARRKDDIWILTVAPRWLARSTAPVTLARLQAFWLGSQIVLPVNAPQSWENVLTGDTVKTSHLERGPCLSVPDVFKDFPVAVLCGGGRSSRTTIAQG